MSSISGRVSQLILTSTLKLKHSGMSTLSPKTFEPLNITPQSKCAGCSSIGEAMSAEEVELQRTMLIPDWKTDEESTRLKKSIKVKNFASALEYVNNIGRIAESENHHPDLTIRSYNHVDITLWTHVLKGLTSNDFILAVKIDTIPIVLSKASSTRTETH